MTKTSIISIPFTSGLNNTVDEKLVQAPSLSKLENAQILKSGSITKRTGYSHLNKETVCACDISSGVGLSSLDSETILFDGSKVWAYAESTEKWAEKGDFVAVKSTSEKVKNTMYEHSAQDMARNDNVELLAWEDSRGGVYASARDAVSGTYYFNDTLLDADGEGVRCFSIGNYSFVVFGDNDDDLHIARMSISDLSEIGTTKLLVDDYVRGEPWDVIEYDDHSAILVYKCTLGGFKVAQIGTNGRIGRNVYGLSEPTPSSDPVSIEKLTIAADPDHNSIAVIIGIHDLITVYTYYIPPYNPDGGTDMIKQSETATVTISGDPVNIGAVIVSATELLLYIETLDTYPTLVTASVDLEVADGVLYVVAGAYTTDAFLKHNGLATRPWLYNGEPYVMVHYLSDEQATYFAVNRSAVAMAKYAPTTASDSALTTTPDVIEIEDGVFVTALLEQGRISSDNGEFFTRTGITKATLDYTRPNGIVSASLGKNLHIANSVVKCYDGLTFAECGFLKFPEIVSATPSGSGGSIATGTYLYQCHWEWTDNHGQVHRSAVSAPKTVSVTGPSGSVVFVIKTLNLTEKTGVSLSLYRTEASGTVYYRVSSPTTLTYNNKTANTITLTDTLADASITTRDIIYTNGGVLDFDPPPPCTVIVGAKNRLFLGGTGDGRLWFSQEHINGEGVCFSNYLYKRADQTSDDIVSLASLDDKIAVLKENNIYIFSGEGPNPTGADDTFTELFKITSDVGCDSHKGTLVTDKGVFFTNAGQITLLDRGLTYSNFGQAVKDYLTGEIACSYIDTEKTCLGWHIADRAVCYNYTYDIWSTKTFKADVVAARSIDGVPHLLFADGYVHKADYSAYSDHPDFTYALVLETAWIKLSNLQGFSRVRELAILGRFFDHHELTVSIGYDYQEYFTDALEFNSTTFRPSPAYGEGGVYGADTYGDEDNGVYQLIAKLPRQKCQAIKFRITTTPSLTQDMSLTGIDLKVNLKAGLNKLPAYRRA